MDPQDARSSRHAIKATVERSIPKIEIDQTKILTEEEIAALKEQKIQFEAAKKLVDQHGRSGLLDQIRRLSSTLKLGPASS